MTFKEWFKSLPRIRQSLIQMSYLDYHKYDLRDIDEIELYRLFDFLERHTVLLTNDERESFYEIINS